MAAAEGKRHRQDRVDGKISNQHCCESQLHAEPQLQSTLANTMHHLLVREEIKGAWNVYGIIYLPLMSGAGMFFKCLKNVQAIGPGLQKRAQ